MKFYSHTNKQGNFYFYCGGDPSQISSYEFMGTFVTVNSIVSVDNQQKKHISAGSLIGTYDGKIYQYVSGNKNLETSYTLLGDLSEGLCPAFTSDISSLTLDQQNKIDATSNAYVVTCDSKLYQYISGSKTHQSSYVLLSNNLIFTLSIAILTNEQQNKISIGSDVLTLQGFLYRYNGGNKLSLTSYSLINDLNIPVPPLITQMSSFITTNTKSPIITVAISTNSDKGAYSIDGINWSEITLPDNKQWRAVTYGNGKYVAIAMNSYKGAYSTDGINWSEIILPSDKSWSTITYGGGKYVILSASTNKGAYSIDGINWSEITLPSINNWLSIIYGDEKYIALSSSGKNAYSTDGINWSEIIFPQYNKVWWCINYKNGKYIAISLNSNKGVCSTDGINWSEITLPSINNWVAIG